MRVRAKGKSGPAITLRSGPKVPVTLPDGFLVYPGARIVSNTVVERGGSRHVLLVFDTHDSVANVTAFYRAGAARAGFALALDLGGPEQASLGGARRGGGTFALTAAVAGNGTRVEIAFD